MKEIDGKIVENREIRENYFILKINAPYICENSDPGNFIMLAVSGSHDPLLKRPFGIFNVEGSSVVIYYEAIGRGTKLLSQKGSGDLVNLIGPLGNTFPLLRDKKIIMVAGGRGIAPLFFAMKRMRMHNDITLVYGAATIDQLNFVDEIKNSGINDLFLYTEDGSGYKKGLVTSEIGDILNKCNSDAIFSCGPHSMLKALVQSTKDFGIPNYASLEADMGCGFGVCHSCVVKNSSGHYIKVCTEGPVFESGEIDWKNLR